MKNCKSLVEDTNPTHAAQEVQMVLRDLLAQGLLPDSLVEACSTCLQQYIQGKCQESKSLAGSGLFWVNMGLVQIQLWTPQTVFDPAVKRAYKLNYAQQEVSFQTNMILLLLEIMKTHFQRLVRKYFLFAN